MAAPSTSTASRTPPGVVPPQRGVPGDSWSSTGTVSAPPSLHSGSSTTAAAATAVVDLKTKSDQQKHVSDPAMEFLLTEVLHWVESICQKQASEGGSQQQQQDSSNNNKNNNETVTEESQILAAEMAAAKLERMGYSVGYRLCERLAQGKSFGNQQQGGGQQNPNKPVDPAQAVAASQLEAVKFLCKEFWMEVFRKQIDKLQTNHRGVFVLKDLELRWLTRLPPNQEEARVAAIQLLAFPCGLVRGALANLNIPAVVSCDFLADGQNMAACSFNIKIK